MMPSPVTAQQKKSAFDAGERSRIRSALLRYMEEHRIGVPTLQGRIAQASDRSPDLIPLKTLQRFLADTHRTNDAFLIPVHQFSKDLPVRSILDELGAAIAGFYSQSDEEGGVRHEARAVLELAGAYEILAPQVVNPDPASGLKMGIRSGFKIPYGRMQFAPGHGGHYLTAEEVIFNLHKVASAEEAEDGVRHRSEGAVLALRPLVVLILRSILSRLPKTYWLRQGEDADLMGNVVEAVFLPGAKPERGYVASDDLLFRRAKE
jgi:hypothetical protein